ncbi:MAG: cytochrome c oxidase subunit 3 [Planctomycetaceae bacterium]
MGIDETPTQGRFAVWFFQAGLVAVASSMFLSWALLRWLPPQPNDSLALPSAFLVTTVLLIAISVFLHGALQNVRLEKQRRFRSQMRMALLLGVMFIGVQGYGIVDLLQENSPETASTSSLGFVAVFTALHILHVSVALLFLVYVTLKSHLDRYDHEYYWGVTVCAYFWHALGVVWLCILAVFAIVL